MLDQILELIPIAKYITIGLGIVGVILLLFGVYRSERPLIARGGYIIVLAITLWICGYFIYTATFKHAQRRINDIYIQY